MRILLTSNAPYAPPKGGSTRSNLIWLQRLAKSGHACRVVCPTVDDTVSDSRTVDPSGIEIHSVHRLSRRTALLSDAIHEFQPDWVLVSSEDLSHVLLRDAHHTAPNRLVYLAHTPQWYPFGPASWHTDGQATADRPPGCRSRSDQPCNGGVYRAALWRANPRSFIRRCTASRPILASVRSTKDTC